MDTQQENIQYEEIVLKPGVRTIGRADDNDIIVNDEAVSSSHARIATFFNASYIEDLNSTNGTYHNGELVSKRVVQPGDVVTIGNHGFVFLENT